LNSTGAFLVVNAGSSSLKFSIFHAESRGELKPQIRGQVDGLGSSPRLTAHNRDGHLLVARALDAGQLRDGRTAMDTVAAWVAESLPGERFRAVGHRVVHGGTAYAQPVLINRRILADLETLIPLAPLHQPFNLAPIRALFDDLPGVPQVACFDTAFHQGRALVTELVPLPWEYHVAHIRRYGFHGLSYEYIASVLPRIAPEIAEGRVLVAHLGSGASLCALRQRRSVDTTLGFTALEGLCMGTRPGSLDPGVLLHLIGTLKIPVSEVTDLLYKKSGLLGLSGISNDMRVLEASTEPRARVALDYFVYRAVKEIGAMAAVLGGLDALVFTAGIGERSPLIRSRILESLRWLGVELDATANERGAARISTDDSRVSAWVIPTDEELMIARHTAAILGL
jgi:acetate kinase